MLGQHVSAIENNKEVDHAGQTIDEDDFESVVTNCNLLLRKVHQSLQENEIDTAANYLHSMHRLLGSTDEGTGSLTHRPRDFSASMSRFADDSSSPSQQRLPTKMEHPKHSLA